VILVLVVGAAGWIAGSVASRTPAASANAPEHAASPADTEVSVDASADVIRVNELQKELDAVRRELEAANQRLEVERKAEGGALRQQLNALRLQRDELEARLHEAATARDPLTQRVSELEAAAVDQEKEKTALEERIRVLEELLNKSAQQTAGVRRELAAAEQRNAESRERIRQLEEGRSETPEAKE
jgi:chromosome segregation ATPase